MTDPADAPRLSLLQRLAILDTDPEPAFDAIAQVAKQAFDMPTALVSLIDDRRQWYKAKVGMEWDEAPRSVSFCEHLLAGPRSVMLVPDAHEDVRFRDNPAVIGEPFVRFYAGAPLILEGVTVGSLCVIDYKPRADFGHAKLDLLLGLAATAEELLRARLENARRRELTHTLERDAGKLAMAEQIAGVGNWTLELDTGAISWSDEVYRIHGVEPDRFNPQYDGAFDFYVGPSRKRVAEIVEQAIVGRRGFSFTAKLKRASDGAIRTVSSKGEYLAGETGPMLFGVFQDVTEQEAMLRQVSESEERYRLLAENAGDMIATLRMDSTIEFVTPASAKVLGYAPDELIGRRTLSLTHPEDRPRVKALFKGLIARGPGGATEPYEFRAQRKDGAWIWLEGEPKVFFDASGKPTHIQDVARDVTARNLAEQAAEDARAAAEAAARAKSDFLANMSHELRTPLTGILGYAEALKGLGGLPDEARRYADRIDFSGRNLLQLVNDVLDLSKIEAGAMELDPHPVEIADLAAQTLELVRPQAEAKSLVLKCALPAATVLELDSGRLRQVLLNLLSNAIKFTEAGEVCLSVACAPGREGRVAVRIAVRDQGIGIAPDRLRGVFGRFEQADNSISRRFGGTGLGLSISRAIAERMGGRLEAESVLGEGSTFSIVFEAREVEDSAVTPVEEAEPAGLIGLRVLVAEDVALNRDLIRIFLDPHGVELTLVENGAEAVAAADATAFDAIVMDMQMPVMDGLEATRRIRGGGGPNRDAPILALTANVLPEEIARCHAAGMTSHVGKPFTATSLAAAVAEAVQASCDNMPAGAAVG